MSFFDYLAEQRDRTDDVGRFAKITIEYFYLGEEPNWHGFEHWEKFIRDRNGGDKAVEALKKAWDEHVEILLTGIRARRKERKEQEALNPTPEPEPIIASKLKWNRAKPIKKGGTNGSPDSW
jgi:hypothetical protein